MNPHNLAQFAERGAASRRVLWGIAAQINGVACHLILNEPNDTQKLEDGGWGPRVSALARIDRKAMPPGLKVALHQPVEVVGKKFTVEELRDLCVHPEIIIGLREV